jgi:hypothetical protein
MPLPRRSRPEISGVRSWPSRRWGQALRELDLRIVFSCVQVEITMPGVDALAPCALAVDYAEQAASRSKAAGHFIRQRRYRKNHPLIDYYISRHCLSSKALLHCGEAQLFDVHWNALQGRSGFSPVCRL